MPLAKMANGSMRDGLSLLDRLISAGVEPLTVELLEEFLGQPNSEKIWDLIGQIGDSDPAGTLAAIEGLVSTGISEVQIVDSLIDYMRDLMVVKSTSIDSELVILTAQQRKRAGELAERFDVAALVYSISTLEKLRWAIKNSDTSRALLEASLLRFALSEHFLNVDTILAQLKSSWGAIAKKKAPVIAKRVSQKLLVDPRPSEKPQGTKAEVRRRRIGSIVDAGRQSHGALQPGEARATFETPSKTQLKSEPLRPEYPAARVDNSRTPHTCAPCDIQLIKDKWQGILSLVSTKLGPGTSSLLSCAVPRGFENGTLVLEFDASARVKKSMCEGNGRPEQIEALMSEEFSTPVRVRFEVAAGEQAQAEPSTGKPKTTGQRRNELLNDPAVKAILMGLDATITGIEED